MGFCDDKYAFEYLPNAPKRVLSIDGGFVEYNTFVNGRNIVGRQQRDNIFFLVL